MTNPTTRIWTTLRYLTVIPLIVLVPTVAEATGPTPDIKANGADGPIAVAAGSPLSITVALDAGDDGAQADWWVLAQTPFGLFHLTLGGWTPGLAVTLQVPLVDLAPLAVLSTSGLPPGAYVFAFGVDLTVNGTLDQPLVADLVAVTIRQRGVSVLGNALAPTQLLVKNGSLYWRDASDVPLNRFSLADEVYTPLVTALPIPENAVSDGQDLYWVSGDRLYKTSLDGTSTVVLDEGERDCCTVSAAIMMDESNVYWANTVSSPTCSPACTFTIRQVPKSGGVATTLTTTLFQPIVAMAIAGGHIFWEERGTGPVSPDGSDGSAIKKVSIADGTVTVLVNGLLNGLITPPPPGHLAGSWHPRGGIVTDGADVYFADADFFDSYRVMKIPVAGGDISVLADITTGDSSIFVRDMALDDSNVYWVDANSLRTIPKAGGSHIELASALVPPVSLAHEGGNLYWLETACCAHGQKGTIKKIATTGGTAVVLKTDIDSPVSVSADASFLYWVEGGSIGGIEGFGRIARVAHDGAGEVSLVQSAAGGPFDVDDTHLYFANGFAIKKVPLGGGQVERLAIGGFRVTDVATDGAYVYWVEDPLATVRKVPVNGGPITTLASGSGPAGAIRLDATHVYWMNHQDSIKRIPKEGGSPTSVVGPVPGFLTDFAVDGVNVYFSEWDAARIRKTPVDGGDISTLVSRSPDQTRRLATDGLSVYWIDQTDVAKVPVSGGAAVFFAQGTVQSNPFLASGIAVDDASVYWTEVAGDVIKVATPK